MPSFKVTIKFSLQLHVGYSLKLNFPKIIIIVKSKTTSFSSCFLKVIEKQRLCIFSILAENMTITHCYQINHKYKQNRRTEMSI